MRITDLPTTTDVTGYMPIDIDGATYKTPVDVIAPNVANNLSTTAEGYVLDARQGKVLADKIAENASGIATTQGTVTTGIVVNSDPWILYESRTSNGTTLYYPRTAKEVLISVSSNTRMYNAIFLPGVIAENITLQLGGYYYRLPSFSTGYYGYLTIAIAYETRAIGDVAGNIDGSSTTSTSVYTTKVYYR